MLRSLGSGLPLTALGYALITALLFRGLLPDLATHLYSDPGDPLLNTAILAWNATHVPLSDVWWNFPSFAPLPGMTALTEHLLLAYPIASPIVWLTGNPTLAYNVVYLIAMPLNALAVFALAREFTASSPAAFVAGLAFMCSPYQAVLLPHIQLMWSFGMPFGLFWLHRYLTAPASSGRARALVWFAFGWLITALSSAYLLVFFPILAGLWCGWFVRPREWRRLIAPALAAAIATLPVVPLLWGYHVRQAAYGFVRGIGEIQAFSADMVSLAGMHHHAAAWRVILPHDFEERALFPGFTILVLGVLALWGQTSPRGGSDSSRWSRRMFAASAVLTAIVLARVWTGPWGWHIGPLPLPPFRPDQLFTVAFLLVVAGVIGSPGFRRAWLRRDPVVFFGVAAVALWLVALGPMPEWSTPWRGITVGPYWLLMQLPGVDAIRVPARAWLPGVLCLAMLAGYGTLAVLRRYPKRPRLIVAVLALMIVAEGSFVTVSVETPRPMRPGVIPEGAVVLDLPIDQGFANAVPQYRAVLGGYRTINGYSGYEPSHFDPLRHAIADMGQGTLDEYRRSDDLYVIIRPGLERPVARWITSLPGAHHLFDVGDARIYRLPAIAAVPQGAQDTR